MKKYTFTGETRELPNHIIIKRIKRIEDNRVGGWIESENNLSHEGDCFVYDNAIVCGNARVYGDAVICDNALVKDFSRVGGKVRIGYYSTLSNLTQILGTGE